MWRRALVGLCLWLTAVSAFAAQERDSAEPATAKSESAPAKAETPLTKAERELARRLVERDEAEQSELTAAKSLEEAKGQLAEAVAADDEKAKEKAEAAVKSATEELADAKAESASAKQLAERAQEAFDLVQKEEDLRQRSAETSSEKDSAVWLESFFKRLSQAKNAREEADLAKQMAASLRKEVGLLQAQLNRVRKDSDEVQKKLSMQGGLSEELKKNLWSERQQITDESRKLSDQILATREEMLMAEATAKTKESQALNEERELGRWWQQILRLMIIFAAVLLTMLVLRVVVNRRVSDPQRRYYLNKVLSLLTALAIVVGLVFVFADQYQNLLTLLGLSVAGLAIALQELVASFAAWFFIKGSRGYRNGDWVAIGNYQGEVVDITFTHTTLLQCAPLADTATISGSLTGGLVVLMNNQVFKQPLVNYTRGFPYVWCSMVYTVTYESDWEKARDLLQNIALEEPEIKQTAAIAFTQIQKMSSELSIQADSTDPVVRTWAAANGIDLTLRFLVHPRRRPTIQDRLNTQILRTIQKSENINFAYNTIRSIPTPPK
ncbi:MAG: mechanosensitive ion channel [Planctomycetes bacterium]|nr:mechanosensitive ion channel [Planctomycetota bacterium]